MPNVLPEPQNPARRLVDLGQRIELRTVTTEPDTTDQVVAYATRERASLVSLREVWVVWRRDTRPGDLSSRGAAVARLLHLADQEREAGPAMKICTCLKVTYNDVTKEVEGFQPVDISVVADDHPVGFDDEGLYHMVGEFVPAGRREATS
jgi:hypothetical protein